MSIPRIIHQIWLGDPMPRHVEQWAETIGKFHPGWSRIIWNQAMLESIGERVDPLVEQYGNWASVTNFLRLKLLQRFGGWYLDTDFEAIDSLDTLGTLPVDAIAAEQDGKRICNAFMAAQPECPWITWQLLHFHRFAPRDAASGVYLATACPIPVYLLPQHYVYPFMYDTPPEQRRSHRDSILIHHWEGSWTK